MYLVQGRQTAPRQPRRRGEDSLQRLGLDRLDIVFVHDLSPDNTYLPEDCKALWPVAEKGAFPALTCCAKNA